MMTSAPPASPAERLARQQEIDRSLLVHSWGVQDDYVPEIVVRAEGTSVWTADGSRYLDFTSQAWFANIGHGDRRVADAIAAQAADLSAIYAAGTAVKLDLTEKLMSLLPPGYERVFFGLNGTDAIEAALKIARLVTGRQNVISFYDEYHGASMGATSVTGVTRLRSPAGQPVPGTVFVPAPYHYRSPLAGATQEETDRRTVAFLRQAIQRTGPETVAAVIGEPMPTGGGGAILPGPDYWRLVREVCDEFGILLIADEVVTGFGRTGTWFALEQFGYEPDILCLAKGLTSGYLPLSAAVFRRPVVDGFRSRHLPHGLTFSGHPVCAAAALANIGVLESDDLVGNAARMGRVLQQRLRGLMSEHPCVGEVQGLGLFATLEVVRDRQSAGSFLPGSSIAGYDPGPSGVAGQVARYLRDRSVRVIGAGEVIRVAPPFIVTEAEVDRVIGLLDEAFTLVDRLTETMTSDG